MRKKPSSSGLRGEKVRLKKLQGGRGNKEGLFDLSREQRLSMAQGY